MVKVQEAAGGHSGVIRTLRACQISLAQESLNNNSHLVSSGPGEELKECPSVSQECLCLACQVASLPYSGQDVGVENYFCFLLEMTTMAQIL